MKNAPDNPNETNPLSAVVGRPRGYTLIELLIVVALISIVAGLVVPQFEPAVHDQLTSVAQIVAADIDFARNLAIANNTEYRFDFYPDENKYVLVHAGYSPTFSTLPLTPFRDPADSPDQATSSLGRLPINVHLPVQLVAVHRLAPSPQTATDVEFGPLGGTLEPEETVIWLGCGSGTNRRYLPVRISPVTGLVAVGDITTAAPIANLSYAS